MSEALIWLGIILCLSQSASFSGLNLAVFSLSRLRLEAAARSGDAHAQSVLDLRRDSNFTLTTILWGNVAVNVLLTLLADSVLAGAAAFLFSTVVITIAGEIMPQAYFSRHALRVAATLTPLLRLYQWLLWPVARPSAKLLDHWIGAEGVPWFREHELRDVLREHARHAGSEVSRLEATGAINFLALDDVPVGQEGEPVDPRSIVSLPFRNGRPLFPAFAGRPDDTFLARLAASGRKWIVLTDASDAAGDPQWLMNAPLFLRTALFGQAAPDPVEPCHRPLVVRDPAMPLGQVLGRLTVQSESPGNDVVDHDVILVWSGQERRIITGSDLLGRLLRGIARPATSPASQGNPASLSRL